MEGQQVNNSVSRNQAANSEVVGRGKRNVQLNRHYYSGDYDTNNYSEGETGHGAATARQRGAQARDAMRGGRGRTLRSNNSSGNTNNSVMLLKIFSKIPQPYVSP